MATTLGLIGLGQVGSRLARNLLKHTFPLSVHDVDAGAVARAVELGASAASSPREIAASRPGSQPTAPRSSTPAWRAASSVSRRG